MELYEERIKSLEEADIRRKSAQEEYNWIQD